MKIIRQIAQDGLYVFAILCVLFIPFPFYMFPFHLADAVFGKLIISLAGVLPGFQMASPLITSDSASMYLLLLILLVLALLLSLIFTRLRKWELEREKVLPLFNKIFAYYLSLQLLKYGFDKIFKGQFYLPEPNTLYTPFGELSKDILFWSAIGTSYLYSFFIGFMEVTAAVCLMFRKTRVFGLMMAVPLLLHVFLINLGFDISVKLYSAFLLILGICLLSPQLGRLYHFLVLHDIATLKREDHTFKVFNHVFISVSLKTLVIGLIFLEALYPAFRRQNFNDDLAERPYLHGAYEVIEVTRGADATALLNSPVKRFFVHRDGYIIFQDWHDRMQDFKLRVNNNREFILTDYSLQEYAIDYEWNARDSIMTLKHFMGEDGYGFKAKALDWRKLPAVQPQFHWTVDAYGNE
jgi:hypothetical protein